MIKKYCARSFGMAYESQGDKSKMHLIYFQKGGAKHFAGTFHFSLEMLSYSAQIPSGTNWQPPDAASNEACMALFIHYDLQGA